MAHNNHAIGITLLLSGVLLLVGSGSGITGAAIGATLQPISGFASGIALLLASLAAFATEKRESLEEKVKKPEVLPDTGFLIREYREMAGSGHAIDFSGYDMRLLKKVKDEATYARPGRQPLVPRQTINYLLSEMVGGRLKENPEISKSDEEALRRLWHNCCARNRSLRYEEINDILEKDRTGKILRADAYLIVEAWKRGNAPTVIFSHDNHVKELAKELNKEGLANVWAYSSYEEFKERHKAY